MKKISRNDRNEIYRYLNNYNKVYIFGAGKEASIIYKLISSIGVVPDYFVVSKKENNPNDKNEIQVVELSKMSVLDKQEGVFIIGVSDLYEEEVANLLKENSISNILKLEKEKELWQINATRPKLEITAKIGCKINCKYCPQELLYRSYFSKDPNRKSLMDFDDYCECIRKMPSNAIICFAGFVEPFFHPHGVEMIEYASKMGHDIELYTTFMGLSYQDWCRIKKIQFMQVVLHTPDINQFATIETNDEYYRILEEALELRKENGKPFIDSANCQSVPSKEFIDFVGGRLLVESSLVDRAGNLDSNELRKSTSKCGRIVCNRSLGLNHWVLLPDCSVILCCMDFGLEECIGNLRDNSYDELFNGEKHQLLMEKMIHSDEDFICRRCTSSKEVH